MMPELYADSIYKSFRGKPILTDIFLRCRKGEIIGLLGRNGAGKSTLLKIIFGCLEAENKFILANGKPVTGMMNRVNRINYLPQHTFLPDHVKIRNLIKLLCGRKGMEIIAENKMIGPLLSKKSRQLSGGEKRLVEIFAIIYSKADYILIDEPFNGISPLFRNDIKLALREQSNQKGFIITDHDYHNIMDIAGRLILLHDGGLKEIRSHADLQSLNYLPGKEAVKKP